MSGTHDCGADAAAYVLGALDERELEAFRAHLRTCTVCEQEVASLTELAGSLPMAAPQSPAPKALRRRVMAEVRADARARRRMQNRRPALTRPALAAGLAVVAAAAVVAGVELAGSTGGTHVYAASVGDAQVRVSDGHAELIVHRLAQPVGNRIYEVWLERAGQAPSPTKALFSVTHGGDGDVDVPGSLHGVDEVLVTEEPAGGTQTPTSSPVIVTKLG